MKQNRAYAPHCDASVLHAPGECVVCDHYEDWQKLRELWRINFTNQYDSKKAPCPSEFFRSNATINRWGGNTAKKPEDIKAPADPLWNLQQLRFYVEELDIKTI